MQKALENSCGLFNNNRKQIPVWYLHGENGYESGSTSEPQPVDRLEEPDVDYAVGTEQMIYEWKQLWLAGKTPKFINPTVWLDLQNHWVDQDTIDKSNKNSATHKSDCGGKGVYVHNLGACSMSSKEDELKEALLASQPISDDDSSAASTNMTRARINEMVEEAVPKKKGRLVGLARRASSCPSSSQAPFAPPDLMIIQQLQNKDDRIVALETQNARILAELAGQKKTNEEILEKMKCLFRAEFS
ncbi:uncharacterized protein LOC125586125 [Brassica napus]|uniref:uncharacterized protein LOC125586125 n=1 Tax=Brassica napus TaxID=3708 RepID=UPI00207A8DF8|nr:uncharacterized protein LOC125586125 [Brassica napus]